MPTLFLRAVEAARALPLPPPLQAAAWLRCLPLPGEAQGFFSPCFASISAALRGAKCVLTAEGELVQPAQAVLCSRPAVRELVGGRLLGDLGLHYAHADLPETPLRVALGVEEVGWPHLIALLRSSCGGGGGGEQQQQAPSACAPAQLAWLVRVLSCMAECAAGAALPKEHLQALSALRVLPLADGSVVAAADGPLYLPIPPASPAAAGGAAQQQQQARGGAAAAGAGGLRAGGAASAKKGGAAPPLPPTPSPPQQQSAAAAAAAAAARAAGLDLSSVGVRLLHPGLAGALTQSADGGAGALRILRALGAAELTLPLLCERHALPAVVLPAASGSASAAPAAAAPRSPELLRAALLLLCGARASLSAAARAALRRDAAVLTSAGPLRAADCSGVLFPPEFGGPLDPAELEWPGGGSEPPWVWLDSGYAKSLKGGSPAAAADVRAFFSEIGVSALGPCVPRELSLTPSDKAESPWASEDWSLLFRPDAPFLPVAVEDFSAPVIEALMWPETLARVGAATLQAVARELSETWQQQWAPFATATVQAASGPTPVPSSFVLALQNANWVPSRLNPRVIVSKHQQQHAAAADAQQQQLSRPVDVFLRTRDAVSGLGSAPVRFAELQCLSSTGGFAAPSPFTHAIGLRGSLDVQAALQALMAWSDSSRSGGGPVPSPAEVAPLYQLLLQFADPWGTAGGGGGSARYYHGAGGVDSVAAAAAQAAKQAIRAAFAAKPLLAFPPRGGGGGGVGGGGGEWVLSADVRSNDYTGVLETLPPGAAPRVRVWEQTGYQGVVHHSFFTYILGCASEAPSFFRMLSGMFPPAQQLYCLSSRNTCCLVLRESEECADIRRLCNRIQTQ